LTEKAYENLFYMFADRNS